MDVAPAAALNLPGVDRRESPVVNRREPNHSSFADVAHAVAPNLPSANRNRPERLVSPLLNGRSPQSPNIHPHLPSPVGLANWCCVATASFLLLVLEKRYDLYGIVEDFVSKSFLIESPVPHSILQLIISAEKLLCGCTRGAFTTAAVLASVEMWHRHTKPPEIREGPPSPAARMARLFPRVAKIFSVFLPWALVATLWFLAAFPPTPTALFHSIWTSSCIFASGYYLCAGAFEPQDRVWKVSFSVCFLILSGRHKIWILALDFFVCLDHAVGGLKHCIWVHHTRRNFHRRVQASVSAGFHPVFVEESFERLVHATLQSPSARRIAYALHHAASFGTQRRRLRRKWSSLRETLHVHHHRTTGPRTTRVCHVLEIDRKALLQSTWSALQETPHSVLQSPRIKVTFTGELGVDEGGLLREWFTEVAHALEFKAEEIDNPHNGIFDVSEKHKDAGKTLLRRLPDGLLVPVPAEVHGEAWPHYFALGQLVALSVRQGVQLPLPFTGAIWKLLLGLPIEAADVAKVDPVFFQNRVQRVLLPRGLKYMEEILGEPLYFVSAETPWQQQPVDLVEGGGELKVTEDNKLNYVSLLCKHYLFGNIEREVGLLCRGFEDLLPPVTLRAQHLDARDLELMVCGLPTVDVEDWQRNTVVSGPGTEYTSGFRMSCWFWEVLGGFGDERRAKLLQFATGSTRVPPEGFIGLDPLFVLHLTLEAPDHLPTANTCVHQLNIPAYPSKRVLVEMLRRACDEATGFGFI